MKILWQQNVENNITCLENKFKKTSLFKTFKLKCNHFNSGKNYFQVKIRFEDPKFIIDRFYTEDLKSLDKKANHYLKRKKWSR